MSKVKLLFTLAALQAMSLEELSIVYEEVKGEMPDASFDADAVLNAILEVADPAAKDPASGSNPPPPPPKLKAGEFVYGDKVYKAILPKVQIPGIGVRTALEIAADEEAQQYLIKAGCIGSVIVEVNIISNSKS